MDVWKSADVSLPEIKSLGYADFRKAVSRPHMESIESDARFYNLAGPYWVYDELLADLGKTGWRRFAPGYKSGIYGHPEQPYCIKLMGMGVGENPHYFCERGYYLAHERNMLLDFLEHGCEFGPRPLSKDDSVRFLRDRCGVRAAQAELRVERDDLMVMEYIPGIPFAEQVGRHISYESSFAQYDKNVIGKLADALDELKSRLLIANRAGLYHNDPMPPNIIFTMGKQGRLTARLVDFELAQNTAKPSPDYVNSSVSELYRERRVPVDPATSLPTMTLDEHLMRGSLSLARDIQKVAAEIPAWKRVLVPDEISFNFLGFSVKYRTRREEAPKDGADH